ncbi:sensor histidine kinase [Jiangella anatolica]|nr:histidine kinase [Jiangella anatolica]
MTALKVAARRHPRVADAVLAGLLAVVSAQAAAELGQVSGAGWVWFAAFHLPLVWRRRAPVVVFWAIVLIGLLWVGDGDADNVSGFSLLVVPMIALYTVARHRSRRHLWAPAALVVPFAIGWVSNGGPWWDVVALAGLFGAAALLGVTVQTRGAYLAEVEERAHRLERERDQQARLAVAAERARIAREMHDIVAHNLAVMVALSDGAAATTPVAPERAVGMMEKASATGREALGEIRRLVGLLRDGESDQVPAGAPAPQPGFDDIDELVGQVRSAGVDVAVTRQGVPRDWGPGAGLTVYRVVQESLTNTMKHAGPRAKAQVRLRYSAAGVDVEIVDDGAGRRAGAAPAPGHGLTGMRERAASFGGRVEAGPCPGAGWRVHLRLPLTTGEDT